MRALLDTNIILDFVLIRQPFFSEADQIFIKLQNNKFGAFVSSITPINVFYITRKEKGKDIAFQAIEELLKIVQIARCDKIVFQNSLLSGFNEYEGAVQHECALAEKLDAVVTRNTKDYKNSSITIYSPKDFLKQL